jgi:thymidylate synthase (FAD)
VRWRKVVKVTLLTNTPDPERIAAAASRQCYSKHSATKAYSEFGPEEIRKQLGIILKNGHLSVLEHATFTFAIEGISRACSHQLVRHRIASYSQQSQRYVKLKEIEFVIPEKVAADAYSKKKYLDALTVCSDAYSNLVERGIPAEDARYILPNATPTKIVVTMNARSLINFFELRCCLSAQWEIRELAQEMLKLVKGIAPIIFENAGPFCLTRRTCPEGKYDCPKWVELYKT